METLSAFVLWRVKSHMDTCSSEYLHCRGIVEYSTNTDADKRLAERMAAKLLTAECIWSYNEYSPVC